MMGTLAKPVMASGEFGFVDSQDVCRITECSKGVGNITECSKGVGNITECSKGVGNK